MRIFSLLALLIVLAVAYFQYSSNIKGSGYSASKTLRTDEIKDQINESVSDYQKKLDEALKNSDSGQ